MRLFVSGAIATIAFLSAATLTAAPPIKFPSRGDALPANAVFETSEGGHVGGYGSYDPNGTWAIDLHAARFEGSRWVRNKADANEASSPGGTRILNEETLIFDAPLYAPIDGEIIACWRTAPDKPDPNSDYDFDGDGQVDQSPLAGGNHLQIRTSDRKSLVFLGHLKSLSIPSNICPLGDTPDWPNSSTKRCNKSDANGRPGDGFRSHTVLPAPVRIKRGAFIGRVGHSGASSAPHLHIHVKPLDVDADGDFCEYPSEQIRFVDSYQITRSSGDITQRNWMKLDRTALTIGSASDINVIWADPISPRLHTAITAGVAHDVHGTVDSIGGVAVYLGEAKAVKLLSFSTSDGKVQIQNEFTDSAAKAVDVVRPTTKSRDVVVVIKGDNDLLKLIPFHVSNGGTIDRKHGSHSGGEVGRFRAVASPIGTGVIVALQDNSGSLKLNGYSVDATTLDVGQPGTPGSGGPIKDVAITSLTKQFVGVATVETTTSNAVNVRTFRVTKQGSATNLANRSTLSLGFNANIVDVSTQRVKSGGDYKEQIIVAAQKTNGDLALVLLDVSNNGQLTSREIVELGPVKDVSLARMDRYNGFVVAAVDSVNELRLLSWGLDGRGSTRRIGTNLWGGVSSEVFLPRDQSGRNLIALVKDDDGQLRVALHYQNFQE